MLKTPKASILIVTYNSGKYIKNTLKSCLNQNYDNFNILILDNNSTDWTPEYIESLKKKKIILYKSKENLWPYKGLNYLLDKTKAEYIAIQDHDDIFHPNKLKETISFLDKNPDYVWCGHNMLVYFEKDKNWYIFRIQQQNNVMHTSLVFRNKWFRYRDNDNMYLEDLYFQRKILSESGKIWNINKVLWFHLIKENKNNLSSNWWKLNIKDIKKFFDIYWYWKYWIQVFIVTLLKKTFPTFFYKIERKVLNKKYWVLSLENLLKYENIKILLDNFYNK